MLWQSEAFTDRLRTAYADGNLPKRGACRIWYGGSCGRCLPSESTDGNRAGAGHERALNETAAQMARQGIVLLQNRGLLPLAPGIGRAAAVNRRLCTPSVCQPATV